MNIKPNVENFALHIKSKCTDKEVHDLVGSLYADEQALEVRNLTVDEYSTAIEIVSFAPTEITANIH